MRKSPLILVATLALALSLSACEFSVTPVAARVDGSSISVSELNGALSTVKNDAGYACYLKAEESSSGTAAPTVGVGSGTYASSYVASELGFLTQAQALQQGLQRLGLASSSLSSTIGKAELTESFTPQSGSTCTQPSATVVNELDPQYRSTLETYYANEAVLAAHLLGFKLTTDGVQAYETAHPAATYDDCINVIVSSSLANANTVESQLAKGAKFGAVAKALSVDASTAQNGGSIGCINPGQLQAPLSTTAESLAVGGYSKPVQYQSTYYVILQVSSRSFPSTTQAALTVVSTETSATAFTTALAKMVKKAQIEVASTYGTVDVKGGTIQVQPWTGPKSSLISNEAALVPKSS